MNTIESFSWSEIKHRIQAANSELFRLIEEVQPSRDLPFFIASYDFGEHFGIKQHAYLPTAAGSLEKIDSKHTDNYLFQNLSYGKNSIPLGIILDKFCEWHYFGENDRVFPDCVQGPGAIFNMQIIFDEDKTVENNVLSASSGALSSFLLPNIGCKRKHSRIEKYYNISAMVPKSPYEHYLVFKEILNNQINHSSWQSQLLYFSEQFIDEVRNNEKWIKLKLFFSESLRKKLNKNTYDASCNDLFLSANSVNRFRPTPFLIDTAKYIFNICMGSGIGVKPAVDEQYFPVREIQDIYHHCYGLEYTPTVMVPSVLNDESHSVYYPLLCPFSKINTFKTNSSNSTLAELEELKEILLAYQDEFSDNTGSAFGSPLYHASKEAHLSFYHYQAPTNNSFIRNSIELETLDTRFMESHCSDNTRFASDAKLFRGCVRITKNTSAQAY